jgi:hypothetical protein
MWRELGSASFIETGNGNFESSTIHHFGEVLDDVIKWTWTSLFAISHIFSQILNEFFRALILLFLGNFQAKRGKVGSLLPAAPERSTKKRDADGQVNDLTIAGGFLIEALGRRK